MFSQLCFTSFPQRWKWVKKQLWLKWYYQSNCFFFLMWENWGSNAGLTTAPVLLSSLSSSWSPPSFSFRQCIDLAACNARCQLLSCLLFSDRTQLRERPNEGGDELERVEEWLRLCSHLEIVYGNAPHSQGSGSSVVGHMGIEGGMKTLSEGRSSVCVRFALVLVIVCQWRLWRERLSGPEEVPLTHKSTVVIFLLCCPVIFFFNLYIL